MNRMRVFLAAVSVAACGLLSPTAHAATSGTILLPCVHPAVTRIAVLDVQHMKVCGSKISGVVPDSGFVLHANGPADLDIYFYRASSDVTGSPSKSFAHIGCADEAGSVPSDASFAIVVLSPSTCGSSANVGFTYS